MRPLSAYVSAFKHLLPSGLAWNWKGDESSPFTAFVKGLSAEFQQIDNDADAMYRDMLPQYTSALLEDWEMIAGLPGPCMALASSTDGRRAALLAKLRMRGGSTLQYMIDRAADMGYTITIEENYGGSPFEFQVNGPLYPVTSMSCTDACTSPLRDWQTDRLTCLISTIRPAHLSPVFAYAE